MRISLTLNAGERISKTKKFSSLEYGAFHFNPAMGYDVNTYSSDENFFDIERWRKNFKDKEILIAGVWRIPF